MTIDRISYSLSLQIHEGLWIKLGSEAALSPEDDYELSFQELKEKVEAMQKKFATPKLVPISEALPVTQTDKTQREYMIENTIEAVKGSSSLQALERFKKLVDREAIPALTEAYYKKQQILNNGLE